LPLAKHKGGNEKRRENYQSTRSRDGGEAGRGATQYATYAMMAVKVISGRPGDAGLLEADDAAKGINNRNREGRDNESLQQDRINRDNANDESRFTKHLIPLTCLSRRRHCQSIQP
jgi:hypothetical protein